MTNEYPDSHANESIYGQYNDLEGRSGTKTHLFGPQQDNMVSGVGVGSLNHIVRKTFNQESGEAKIISARGSSILFNNLTGERSESLSQECGGFGGGKCCFRQENYCFALYSYKVELVFKSKAFLFLEVEEDFLAVDQDFGIILRAEEEVVLFLRRQTEKSNEAILNLADAL